MRVYRIDYKLKDKPNDVISCMSIVYACRSKAKKEAIRLSGENTAHDFEVVLDENAQLVIGNGRIILSDGRSKVLKK